MFSHPGNQLISLRSQVKIIKKRYTMQEKNEIFSEKIIFPKMSTILLKNKDSLNTLIKD